MITAMCHFCGAPGPTASTSKGGRGNSPLPAFAPFIPTCFCQMDVKQKKSYKEAIDTELDVWLARMDLDRDLLSHAKQGSVAAKVLARYNKAIARLNLES